MRERNLKELTVEISKKRINAVYYPYLDCEKRYLILYGGAGSGKSVFAAQRAVLRLLVRERCNLLVVRKVARTNRDSTFALFRQVINDWHLGDFFRVLESDMRILCTLNENSVLFAGLDDVEKLKSVTFPSGELTEIWVEEASEISESDFNQLDVRLRGGNSQKQICLSFNPVNANHWLKRRFFDRACGDAAVLHTTYRDNRFLDAAYRRVLEGYRETDPYYYEVYCLGQWGVYGRTVFDARKINQRLSELRAEGVRGRFEFDSELDEEAGQVRIADGSIRRTLCGDGEILFYREPEAGVPYVIGCDTAGEGSDFFVAQVLDNRTGAQVAVLHSAYDEDVFAGQVYCLGRYYNSALVGIEANFSTYPIRELERLGYERQYVRMTEDRFTHRMTESYGVRTTASTRPVMLGELVKVVRETPELICDRATLMEMLTFVRNEAGRAEAQSGAHDDLVMALAIAHYIRPQQANEKVYSAGVAKQRLPDALREETEEWTENGVMVW